MIYCIILQFIVEVITSDKMSIFVLNDEPSGYKLNIKTLF